MAVNGSDEQYPRRGNDVKIQESIHNKANPCKPNIIHINQGSKEAFLSLETTILMAEITVHFSFQEREIARNQP